MRRIAGAVEQTRTAEPHPYQGCALPPELQQRIALRIYINGPEMSRLHQCFSDNPKQQQRICRGAAACQRAAVRRDAPEELRGCRPQVYPGISPTASCGQSPWSFPSAIRSDASDVSGEIATYPARMQSRSYLKSLSVLI